MLWDRVFLPREWENAELLPRPELGSMGWLLPLYILFSHVDDAVEP